MTTPSAAPAIATDSAKGSAEQQWCITCGAPLPTAASSNPVPAAGTTSAPTATPAAETAPSRQHPAIEHWLMSEDRAAMLNIIALDRARLARIARDGLITDTTYRAVVAELSIAEHAISQWAGEPTTHLNPQAYP